MAESAAPLSTTLSTLNTHIEEFNEFLASESIPESFPTLFFLGNLHPRKAEDALIEHWNEFLQFSRVHLNDRRLPTDPTLGHVDTINLDYKRTLEAVQSIPRPSN